MIRNQDPNAVVMSKEHYQALINQCTHGIQGFPRAVDKHVRKMNPHRQAAHQARVKQREATRSEMIRSARKFKETYVGKPVFAKVAMGKWEHPDAPVYLPITIIRIAKDRRFVDVLKHEDEFDVKHKRYKAITIDGIIHEIPDNYIKGYGPYREYYVKVGGPHDIKEEEERKDLEWKAKQAAKQVDQDAPGDVLVEVR